MSSASIKDTCFPVAGKTFLILGLARSGLTAAQWLKKEGASVLGWDDNADRRQAAQDAGVPLLTPKTIPWETINAVVHSPGIPWRFPQPHPITAEAVARGIPLLTDCALLRWSQPHARFVGVTGTNGKSTTTALIGHILAHAGLPVAVGGNIGVPALGLPPLPPGGVYVLELSSFQLALSPPLDLHVAVWINFSEDHLDRHGSLAVYEQDKRRIFTSSLPLTAVIGLDDDPSRQVYEEIGTRPSAASFSFAITHAPQGSIYVDRGVLIDDSASEKQAVLDLVQGSPLQGQHNAQNIAAAYGATRALGLTPQQIAEGIRTFKGLPHRQETVAVVEGVRFINDSKATNVQSAARALTLFDPIYWIAGGRPKSDDILDLEPYFNRIRHVFLIGEAQASFAQALAGKLPYTLSGDLETAVSQAYAHALQEMVVNKDSPQPVVLLAPACPSYDQFRDFEHRGEVFRQTVLSLQPKRPPRQVASC